MEIEQIKKAEEEERLRQKQQQSSPPSPLEIEGQIADEFPELEPF